MGIIGRMHWYVYVRESGYSRRHGRSGVCFSIWESGKIADRVCWVLALEEYLGFLIKKDLALYKAWCHGTSKVSIVVTMVWFVCVG